MPPVLGWRCGSPLWQSCTTRFQHTHCAAPAFGSHLQQASSLTPLSTPPLSLIPPTHPSCCSWGLSCTQKLCKHRAAWPTHLFPGGPSPHGVCAPQRVVPPLISPPSSSPAAPSPTGSSGDCPGWLLPLVPPLPPPVEFLEVDKKGRHVIHLLAY